MLTQTQLGKLLNRSLTTAEESNFSLYLKIATARLEELLCMSICGEDGARTYESRYGYRTVYVDPLTEVNSVKINDETVTNYTLKQNDKLNGSWYNVIEFDTKRTGQKIVVDAAWGFDFCPADLQLLLATIYDHALKQNVLDRTVSSKKVEDFSISYNLSSITMKDSLWESLVKDFAPIIDKYSLCNQSVIRHGCVDGKWDYGIRSVRY